MDISSTDFIITSFMPCETLHKHMIGPLVTPNSTGSKATLDRVFHNSNLIHCALSLLDDYTNPDHA